MSKKDSSAQHVMPEGEIGIVEPKGIVEEVQQSYLDYAMSVIVARALPDVRDGMKPVQRRVLYAMWDMGLRPGARYRKSATVVGEVLGKYHPHSDAAAYDTLARMAQDFSLRYTLVDGQGNFGSIDGDNPAAMRYCVTGETLVVSDRGLVPIEHISPQKEEDIDVRILSRDRTMHRATKWFDSGDHPTVRVTTHHGFTITGTTNHPILVLTQGDDGGPELAWKLLGNLLPSDVAVLDRSDVLWPEQEISTKAFVPEFQNRRTKTKQLPPTLTPDLAWILGALVAEGTIGEKEIEFCNSDEEFLREFQARWLRTFPDCRLHVFHRAPTSFGKKPFTIFEIHSRYVIAFLHALGCRAVRSAEKDVPSAILQSPRRVVAAFLQSYFEGDGTVTSSGRMIELGCCSKSQQLTQTLQILLLRFGIVATRRFDTGRAMHKLYVRGAKNYHLFTHEISFVSSRKRQRLEAINRRITRDAGRFDSIPFLANFLRTNLVPRHPLRQFALKHRVDHYGHLERNAGTVLTAMTPQTRTRATPLLSNLMENQYLFDPVVGIEDAGVQHVYSMRVASDCHSFVANGFVNHNTEAKLERIAEEMLLDIEKNTVDFIPNYDESHQEPTVLPAKLPNLLLNGTVGIAVGMATSIPPHNLTELCGAIEHLLEHPGASVDDLMQFVTGPDFPTGGEIYDASEIKLAYATGKGRIVMRATAEVEETKDGGNRIIINSIPYQVNKSFLVEKIADLVRDKKLDGIKDLRDESDREGVRIVIDLKKDSYPKKVLNRLYDMTQLQDTFHVNLLAIVDGIQPRVLTLKSILEEFIKHRQVVVRRRTEYDLEKAKARAHILEGLKIALDHLDAVIKLIRASRDRDEAKVNLMQRFKLSELQANAILDMRLSQLANLERQKIEDEYKAVRALMKELEAILANPKKVLQIIQTEMKELKEKYGDERRTKVFPNPVGKFTQEDLIPNESTIIMVTRDGYIKRLPPTQFKTQSRGGKGVMGLTVKEEDLVEQFFSTMTHTDLLFFTSRGRVFQLKAYEVPPAGSRTARGQALVNFLQLMQSERVTAILPLAELEDSKFLIMVTNGGTIKKVALDAFANVRRSGLIAMKLKNNDVLEWVKPSTGGDDVLMVTTQGQSIRYAEKFLRAMGRNASGVRGMRLKGTDRIAGMDIVMAGQNAANEQLLVVTTKGFGKRTGVKFFRNQGRGGSGIKCAKVTDKTGKVVAAFIVNAKREKEDLICISNKGQVIRLPLQTVSVLGRDTQGVRIMRFKEGDDELSNVAFV